MLEFVLSVEVGEGGKVHAVNPARGGAMEGHLPEPDMADHELVRPLHVVQRPASVLFPQIPDEHLGWAKKIRFCRTNLEITKHGRAAEWVMTNDILDSKMEAVTWDLGEERINEGRKGVIERTW